MTKKERDKIIKEYKEAYHQLYKEDAELTFVSSWIRINGSFSKYRLSNLPKMTKVLRDRINNGE